MAVSGERTSVFAGLKLTAAVAAAAVFAIALMVPLAPPAVAADESPISVDNPKNSLVFGYIDMSDAPTKLKGAWLRQVAPPTDSPYWSMGIEKGLFYNTFIRPGTYQLSSFAGSSYAKGSYEYNFPRQGRNQTAVKIKKPGIYYLGSYKYVKVRKGGMFKQAKFSIERVDEPTEAELLRRILEDTMKVKKAKNYKGPRKIKIEDTRWAAAIRARLKELE